MGLDFLQLLIPLFLCVSENSGISETRHTFSGEALNFINIFKIYIERNGTNSANNSVIYWLNHPTPKHPLCTSAHTSKYPWRYQSKTIKHVSVSLHTFFFFFFSSHKNLFFFGLSWQSNTIHSLQNIQREASGIRAVLYSTLYTCTNLRSQSRKGEDKGSDRKGQARAQLGPP